MAGSLRPELGGEAARALESLVRATGRPAREVVEMLVYAASGIVEPVPP
ncbi:hypothetical protein [Pyrodictium abyssi]|uniref:ANTAR domain-containing protein n=1 Tax=Pyrodictium abyssi TaxID=54256 RepID=A0ABM8IYX7_9CREN|nr:hypothetical protein PABY_23100 [Pyrodictium abyssi]